MPRPCIPRGSVCYPFSELLADTCAAFGIRHVAAMLAPLPRWEREFWWRSIPALAFALGIEQDEAVVGR